MVLEGYADSGEGTLVAVVGEDVTVGLNKELDMAWIEQSHGHTDDVIAIHIGDAKALIKLLQTWVDAQ